MLLRLHHIGTLAALTLLECLRQPVCLLITVATLVGMGVLPLVITHQFGETGKLVRDSVLALFLSGGLLLAANAAAGAARLPGRRGTVGLVLTKPVRRLDYLLAKFLGLAGFMLLYSLLATLGVLLGARTAAIVYEIDLWGSLPLLLAPLLGLGLAGAVNYLTQRPFASTAWLGLAGALVGAVLLSGFRGGETPGWVAFGTALDARLLPACALLGLATLLLQGVALTLAVRLDVLPVAVLSFGVFLAGLVSDHFFGRHAATDRLAAFAYAVLPNWSHFWLADALTGGGTIATPYLATAALYTLCYLGGLYALAAALFDRAEVGA
jgi:hypothetical protein